MAVLDGFADVFADASFLVAIRGAGDAMHPRAIELLEAIDHAGSRL